MSNSKTVSVIVPVYNAERFIDGCITSILNQTYENIELILVNDGSSDSSGLICDTYATSDPRVKVVHQDNSGPSAARNTGMNVARGWYIQFVDCDDRIEQNMTEELVTAMENGVELAICGYQTFENHDDKKRIEKKSPSMKGLYEKKDFMSIFGSLFEKEFINPLWNKLYVKKIIEKYDIEFIQNIKMGEDLLFNLSYFNFCDNVSIVDSTLYNYLVANNSSLTGNFIEGYYENQQMLFYNIRQFLSNNNTYNNNKKFIESTYLSRIIGCLSNLFHSESRLTHDEVKETINKIIVDHHVRDNLNYLNGSIQEKTIRLLIENESSRGIFQYFRLKKVLKNNVNRIFELSKSLNRATKRK